MRQAKTVVVFLDKRPVAGRRPMAKLEAVVVEFENYDASHSRLGVVGLEVAELLGFASGHGSSKPLLTETRVASLTKFEALVE